MVDKRLTQKPEERILYCISPPAAKFFGYLPVELSEDGKTLGVIVERDFKGSVVKESVKEEMFRKKIKVVGDVDSREWEKAYNLFYEDILH